MMPQICSAAWTICGAASDAAILRLFNRSAQPIDSRSSISSPSASKSAAHDATLCRSDCSITEACASRVAADGTVPGFFRASARTYAAPRAMASLAIPSHTAAQRMCEYGTIDCADESANDPGTICASAPDDVTSYPG